MSLDFALLLVIGVVITGLIWALDALFFAPQRQRTATAAGPGQDGGAADRPAKEAPRSAGEAPQLAKEPIIVEYARSFFPVLLIVLVLRSFVVEPFRIPSGSMLPTLLVGDFILVNKFSYGIRLPVVNTKIIPTGEPEHGDVAVFRYPENPSLDYIKRVVGLPGDEIAYFNKVLYVNGTPAEQDVVGRYEDGTGAVSMRMEGLGDLEHPILVNTSTPSINIPPVTVPEGMYFVMGDNRDNSRDSRAWGFVPEDHLVGEAFLIWMNWNSEEGGVTWSRIGTIIN